MRHLERFFYSYGQWVGSRPWPFTVLPLLLTIISGYGFLYFRSDDDIWDLYAPSNGISRVEENALRPFEFASSTHHYRMQILVTRKDRSNLLEKRVLREINQANNEVDKIQLGYGMNYSQICGVYCNETNEAILAFLEALIGILSPAMALFTTFGLLFWCNVPFSNVLTVVPFLVITIGIDDAFLILAGWRQSDPSASLPDRIGQSLAISGASVTVTSFTDVICFAVTFFTAFVAIISKQHLKVRKENRVSSYYATKINTNFDMENLYMADSPLTEISRTMQNLVLKEAYVSVAFWGEALDGEESMWSNKQILENYRQSGIDEKFLLLSRNQLNQEKIIGFYFTVTYHNLKNFLEVEALMEKRWRNVKNKEKHRKNNCCLCAHSDYQKNAVSLISILMSIGFSVDYSAHISYHYFAHAAENNESSNKNKICKMRDNNPMYATHLHSRECNFLIEQLEKCSKEKPFMRFFDGCGEWTLSINNCIENERVWRRDNIKDVKKYNLKLKCLPEELWTPMLKRLKAEGKLPNWGPNDDECQKIR
ncbi:hypothetical protein WR25_03793 [Diploscapter pachys]|uniref:SSD domain-containing protein n=1 Tax=Diploscapter pachys TaxID=2018661 RepID=A0A2A2LNF3_9BILA|nr:hypothetical protein WR25_03793 [Diploscapter pachys]